MVLVSWRRLTLLELVVAVAVHLVRRSMMRKVQVVQRVGRRVLKVVGRRRRHHQRLGRVGGVQLAVATQGAVQLDLATIADARGAADISWLAVTVIRVARIGRLDHATGVRRRVLLIGVLVLDLDPCAVLRRLAARRRGRGDGREGWRVGGCGRRYGNIHLVTRRRWWWQRFSLTSQTSLHKQNYLSFQSSRWILGCLVVISRFY